MAQKHYRSRERSRSYRRDAESSRDSSRSYRKRRRYDEDNEHSHTHDHNSASSLASSHYDTSYNHINYKNDKDEKHYDHKRSRRHYSTSSCSSEDSHIPSWDDEERHYVIHLGDNLIPRYKILSEMGEGTFGRVVECWDRKTKRRVAVKIVRAIEKYRDAARLEIEVLDTLQKYDPDYTQPLIQLLSWFDFRGHICMVFEKHGLSLYDFLRNNSFRPFTLPHVREMGFQLLHSIAFLHSLSLIHTDLKPENILLVDSDYNIRSPPSNSVSDCTAALRVPRNPEIKLIDFGSATFDHRYHTTVVSTRHYRAPEVILGMGWSYPCDIWSIGCILIQLYTGDALFQARENREHLKMMEKVLGAFPDYFVEKADRHSQKYFQKGSVLFPPDDVTSSQERAKQLAYVKYMRRLDEYMATPDDDLFLDLLYKLFEYDPHRRITAREAMKHPFFDSVRNLYKYKPVSHKKQEK